MEEKKFTYRIDGIDIIEKSIFRSNIKDGEVQNFEIKTQTLVDDSKDLIIILVQVKVKKAEEPNEIAKVIIGVGFNIENFKNVFEKNEKDLYIIPPNFENMLKTISISTMRGVMYSEFRGTYLHTSILPIVMTDSLVPVKENIIDIVGDKVAQQED